MSTPSPLSGALDRTEIHDILRNSRRRRVLNSLYHDDGSMSLRDLSEVIAAEETGEDPAPRNVRQSVYVSLHQTHLPKLDDHDVVDYDTDSKTVTLADGIDDVRVYMEVVPQDDISWAEYYLGLSVLGLALTGAHTVGVPALSTVDVRIWLSGVLLLFAASAAYQLARQRPSLSERFVGQ